MKRLTDHPKLAFRAAAVLGTVAAALLLAGCSSTMLPNTINQSQSTWTTYQAAKTSYDTITVGVSKKADVHKLGFDPATIPNVRIINYVDVVNMFGASFDMEDLPPGIRSCVSKREDCLAYAVTVREVVSQRDGNIPADLLGFQKSIKTTGWEFNATIVMVDDKVVYKLWNGVPDIQSRTNEFTPLGPMQNVGGIIPKPF